MPKFGSKTNLAVSKRQWYLKNKIDVINVGFVSTSLNYINITMNAGFMVQVSYSETKHVLTLTITTLNQHNHFGHALRIVHTSYTGVEFTVWATQVLLAEWLTWGSLWSVDLLGASVVK